MRKIALAAAAALTLAAPASFAKIDNGSPAPLFRLNSSLGKQLSLADFRGQVVLVNFWASWCGPCRKEMPVLEQIYQRYKARGVTLVGVNVEPDSAAGVQWLKATPVSFPILFDTDSAASKLYDVEGMPNTVIVDRKGNVRYIHRGYKDGAANEYMDQLNALIREK